MKIKYYQIILEPAFELDYKELKRRHPELLPDFRDAIRQLALFGIVGEEYKPHILDNPGGLYNGNYEFHLSDGVVDILVVYMPHKTNPAIRLVRIGSHLQLFSGPEN